MLQAKSKRSFNRHTEMTQLFPWVWTIRWLWCGFWQTWAPKKVAKWLLFATTAVSLEMGDTYVGGEREKKERERESWGKVQLTSHATIILRHIFLTVWHSYLFTSLIIWSFLALYSDLHTAFTPTRTIQTQGFQIVSNALEERLGNTLYTLAWGKVSDQDHVVENCRTIELCSRGRGHYSHSVFDKV